MNPLLGWHKTSFFISSFQVMVSNKLSRLMGFRRSIDFWIHHSKTSMLSNFIEITHFKLIRDVHPAKSSSAFIFQFNFLIEVDSSSVHLEPSFLRVHPYSPSFPSLQGCSFSYTFSYSKTGLLWTQKTGDFTAQSFTSCFPYRSLPDETIPIILHLDWSNWSFIFSVYSESIFELYNHF